MIEFEDINIKVSTLIEAFLFLILLFIILKFLKTAINKSSKFDAAKKYSIYQLVKYTVFTFGILIFLQILGFKVAYLLVGSSALLVGLGFGLQNLFSDFISGIIILLDSSVKVDDVIEINDIIGRVTEIKFRTTTIITREDKYIIIPNTDLTKNNLINWTHENVTSRFEVTVGVDYSSDVHKVMSLLYEATIDVPGVLDNPKPFIRFIDFADSSLNFCVLFYSTEVFRIESIKSEIRVKIFEVFKENNIKIPFPQRVVHLNRND